MAVVYLAQDLKHERKVALKVLKHERKVALKSRSPRSAHDSGAASIRMDLPAIQAPNGMVWEYLIRMVR